MDITGGAMKSKSSSLFGALIVK